MSQSATKRQRVSVDRYVSRESENEAVTAQSNPTTPTRRASYLSPTKASLARSHPNLLSKSPRKAITEPKGASRKDSQPVAQATGAGTIPRQQLQNRASAQPEINQPPLAEFDLDGPKNAARELATEIALAFKDLPIEIPAQNVVQFVGRSQQDPNIGIRKPLISGQPRATRRSLRGLESLTDEQEDEPREFILPKLVKRSEVVTELDASNEVDLPPTPVQLGLSAVPQRPRGLASSSSAGSRSGSGRHRTRVRDGRTGSVTSSPLKPRQHTKPAENLTNGRHQSEDLPDGTPESDIDHDLDVTNLRLSDEVKQKQSALSDLTRQLEALRTDIKELEKLTTKLEGEEAIEIGSEFMDILNESNQMYKRNLLDIDRTFVTDNEAYLRLFAPAGLQLDSTTRAITVLNRPKIVHTLTISAPKPWSLSTLQLSFNIIIDAKNVCIDNVGYLGSPYLNDHKSLQKWIRARTNKPLHKHDLGGLIFGAGNYLEACIERAKVFGQLGAMYDDQVTNAWAKENISSLDQREAIEVSRYMDMTQLTLSCAPSTVPSTGAASKAPRKQILITYEIDLTWTGTVHRRVYISCTGVGMKSQKSAQDLFQKLIKTRRITDAFGGVWKMLDFSTDAGNLTTSLSNGIVPAKRSQPKARAG